MTIMYSWSRKANPIDLSKLDIQRYKLKNHGYLDSTSFISSILGRWNRFKMHCVKISTSHQILVCCANLLYIFIRWSSSQFGIYSESIYFKENIKVSKLWAFFDVGLPMVLHSRALNLAVN